MFCAQDNSGGGFSCRLRRIAAFTLLEVMLAVAIIAMIALSIYGFLETNLRAIQFSTEQSSEQTAMHGLISMLQLQMNSLPRSQPGALLGDPHKFNNLSSDELQWLCGPGAGLFTRNATGEYRVTLALKTIPKTRDLELGLRRKPSDSVDDKETNWLHLMDGVKALEIRYFDLRLNAWLEKWNDQNARPTLVRVRIWRTADIDPYEVVLTLPLTNAPPTT